MWIESLCPRPQPVTMTDEQAQQFADAIVAVEYGEFVKSLLDQVDTEEMPLEEVLDKLNRTERHEGLRRIQRAHIVFEHQGANPVDLERDVQVDELEPPEVLVGVRPRPPRLSRHPSRPR